MAKFNLEIELDWIDEGDNLDSTIKNEVVKAIVDRVVESVIADVKQQVNNDIAERIKERVDETYEELLEQPIVVTDRWGEEKEAFSSLTSAIKTRVDHYFTESVKSNGSTAGRYDSSVGNRLQWLIDNRVAKEADKKIKEAVEQVEVKIKKTLDEKFKSHVSSKINDLMDFEQFLNTKKLKSGK